MSQPSDHSSLSVCHLSFLSLVDMIMIYSPSFSIRAHLSITHSLSTHSLSSPNTCPIQFFFFVIFLIRHHPLIHYFPYLFISHFITPPYIFQNFLSFHNHTYSACNLKTNKTKKTNTCDRDILRFAGVLIGRDIFGKSW